MFKPVIVGYARSPFTMARKGALIDVKPVNLLSEVVKNLVSKSKINKEDIEDIVVGCAFQVGEQCCLLYTSPSPRDATLSRMPSSA